MGIKKMNLFGQKVNNLPESFPRPGDHFSLLKYLVKSFAQKNFEVHRVCEKLLCEVLNEVGKPQEQVPPMAARKYTPEKIENHEKPESGPPSACVIGKNRKDLQEFKVKRKNGKVVKEGVKNGVKKIK